MNLLLDALCQLHLQPMISAMPWELYVSDTVIISSFLVLHIILVSQMSSIWLRRGLSLQQSFWFSHTLHDIQLWELGLHVFHSSWCCVLVKHLYVWLKRKTKQVIIPYVVLYLGLNLFLLHRSLHNIFPVDKKRSINERIRIERIRIKVPQNIVQKPMRWCYNQYLEVLFHSP